MGIEEYHVIELVGEGSFGKVYKGRRKFTGQVIFKFSLYFLLIFIFLFVILLHIFQYQTVAMKFIMKHGKTEKDIHNLRQEIEVFRNAFSIKIYQCFCCLICFFVFFFCSCNL